MAARARRNLRVRPAGLKCCPALLEILLPFLDVQIRSGPRAVFARVVGIAIDRVAGPVEAECFLLVIELLDFGPWRNVWQLRVSWRAVFVAAAKQIRLPQVLVPLRPRPVIARGINGCQQLRASVPQWTMEGRVFRPALCRPLPNHQRVAGARLGQRFKHTFVGKSQVENLAERVQRSDASAELSSAARIELTAPSPRPLMAVRPKRTPLPARPRNSTDSR